MSASSPLTLYDVPSKQGQYCWSPNVWKTRLALNYKRIPYTTTWIDFPDIEPTLRADGVRAQSTVALGAAVGAEYTLPTIRLPADGEFVMDSTRIADALEAAWPKPSLNLQTKLHEQADAILRKCALPLYPELAPRIRDELLTERGKAHWVEAREKLFGMPIDEFHSTLGGEQAWTAAGRGLQELRAFARIHKRDEGPFVLGSAASYADFVVVAFLKAARGAGEKVFEGIIGGDAALTAMWDACRGWLDHDR